MSLTRIARNEDSTLDAYAWPGGYQLFYVCLDGGILCPACANLPEAKLAGEDEATEREWTIDGVDANFEDEDLTCDHCNESIPASCAD